MKDLKSHNLAEVSVIIAFKIYIVLTTSASRREHKIISYNYLTCIPLLLQLNDQSSGLLVSMIVFFYIVFLNAYKVLFRYK